MSILSKAEIQEALHDAEDEDLLGELQRRYDGGIVAVQLPDTDSNLYLWWGARVVCLGLTSRLAHGINLELEGMEETEETSGPIDEAEELAREFPQLGQYL